jgi:Xaa-Pro aminopeptidase
MRIDSSLVRRRARKIVDALDSTVIIPRWGVYSPSFFYFAGMDVDHSIAVLHRNGGITVISNQLNEALAKDTYSRIAEVIIFDKNKTAKETLAKVCGKKCVLDVGHINYGAYRRLHTKGMKPVAKELLSAREIKEPGEIASIRRAKQETIRMLAGIEVKGKGEEDVRRQVLLGIAGIGCVEAFGTIVANSRNARFPHYTARANTKINDYVLIDMGIRQANYNSDITRCIGNLGKMQKTYDALKHASAEIADAAAAGKKIRDFIAETDMIMKRNGLKEFPHGIGHGIGLEVHEFPHMYAKSKDTLKENSVITIEPGQYFEKGLRYEDMYVIGKKNARLL